MQQTTPEEVQRMNAHHLALQGLLAASLFNN
jgi:hypothetical protein